jgi:hypothetical protein
VPFCTNLLVLNFSLGWFCFIDGVIVWSIQILIRMLEVPRFVTFVRRSVIGKRCSGISSWKDDGTNWHAVLSLG